LLDLPFTKVLGSCGSSGSGCIAAVATNIVVAAGLALFYFAARPDVFCVLCVDCLWADPNAWESMDGAITN